MHFPIKPLQSDLSVSLIEYTRVDLNGRNVGRNTCTICDSRILILGTVNGPTKIPYLYQYHKNQ